MTLIECFTDSHIDNIAACLRLRPEKVVMVGDGEEMDASVKRYRKLLKQRGQSTEISLCDVSGKDIGDVCAVLREIVKKEAECVIDLTGGDEAVIMAVGAMLVGLGPDTRKQIRVEKYDREQDAVLDCINDNRRLSYKPISLSVEELILLHGGILHPNAYQPPEEYTAGDVAGLWRIVAEMPKDWNLNLSYLNQFEKCSDSKTEIYLRLKNLNSIADFDRKEAVVRDLLARMHNGGVIDDHSSRDVLEYTYNSPLLRYCTKKAGNVLEVKTLLEGRSVMENGEPFFNDCRMSVSIDWDGQVHKSEEKAPETRNEIDVVLMHGMIPLFISCKNGDIEDEELYKLHTVAERFGGPYARKMLIATNLDRGSPAANRAFEKRAEDMGIQLVTDAGDLLRNEWKQRLKQAVL